jgi:hypothetical protein
MSPKVIIRHVDADTLKPIMQDIRAFKRQIEQEKDKERKGSLQGQLEELRDAP